MAVIKDVNSVTIAILRGPKFTTYYYHFCFLLLLLLIAVDIISYIITYIGITVTISY